MSERNVAALFMNETPSRITDLKRLLKTVKSPKPLGKQLDDAFRRPNLATVSVKLERLP
jgi:hypothetical protein